MIYLQITVNYYVWIYNVTMAFVGAFVVVNLVMAIVAIKFIQYQDAVSVVFSSKNWKTSSRIRWSGIFSVAKT